MERNANGDNGHEGSSKGSDQESNASNSMFMTCSTLSSSCVSHLTQSHSIPLNSNQSYSISLYLTQSHLILLNPLNLTQSTDSADCGTGKMLQYAQLT